MFRVVLLRTLLVGSAIFISSPSLRALDPRTTIPDYQHQTWQQEQGLPQNVIRRLLQTRDGYLWMATVGGLVRFDGVRFVDWETLRPPASWDYEVETLFEDSRGYLWVGIRQGGFERFRYRSSALQEAPVDNPRILRESTVWSIHEDRAGAIWFCTESGLFRYRDSSFQSFTTKDGLTSDQVRDLYEDRDGTLWIATDAGLNRFRDERFRAYTEKKGLPSRDVRVVIGDRSGNLWIGTHGGGLSRLRDGRFQTLTTRDGLASNFIRALTEDRDGNLWIGTADGGLVRFRDGRLSAFDVRNGLTHNSVLSLLEDREGGLWIGTRDGLNRLKDARVLVYDSSDGLVNDNVRAIYEDAAGVLWIGTQAGLTRLDRGHALTFNRQPGLSDEAIWSISGDAAGNVWMGTAGGKLIRFRAGQFTTYAAPHGLSDGSIRDLEADDHGGLWIATQRGRLHYFKDERFRTIGVEHGLSGEAIYSLGLDRDGALWIGTDGRGLSILRDGRIIAIGHDRQAGQRIRCIFRDSEGVIWIGTRGGGLQRWQNGTVTVYNKSSGLPDDIVYQILEDDDRNLWMSSSRGVFRVLRRDLDAVAAGRSTTINALTLGKAEGMPTDECSGASQPAGFKARDGTLWFATTRGMAGFRPHELRVNSLPPPVVLEEMMIDEQPADLATPVVVPPGKRRLEFRFTGLSLVVPEKVVFRYRLQGFDREWIDAGTRRFTHYMNLPPGPYTFEVQARNNDGVWNESGARVSFRLQPFFYQTNWFYTLCGLTVIGIAAAIFRLRVHELHAQFSAVLAERNRIARELHDTLQQGLTAAALQVESARLTFDSDPTAAHTHLDATRDLIQASLGESRRSIQDLRASALQSGDLGAALRDIARQLTGGTSVTAEVLVRGSRERLPAHVESQLLRIGQEAMTNAIKHARARSITVELERRPGAALLSVSDDGSGLGSSERPADRHYGLLGMEERARSLGGDLQVKSAPGAGTVISVRVPLAR